MGKKTDGQKWVLALLLIAVCAVALSRFPIFTLTVLLGLLLTYGCMVLHILFHEAGHLIFGLLTGYRFSSFRIFSFMWLKIDGKLKLKRYSLAGTGGQCLMVPPDLKDGKLPVFWYNMGGAILNLLVAVLFLPGYWSDIPIVSLLCYLFALTGFVTAALNGLPLRMGSVDNDGYNAVALAKNQSAKEAFWVQMKVAEQTAKGVRLRDMPEVWFTVPTEEAMKNSMVAARGVFACNRLMDMESFAAADKLMAQLLSIPSGMVGLHRSLLICDRLYIELIGENRQEIVSSMLTKQQKKFMQTMRRFPSVLRTEYALALLLEKDSQRAETILQDFEAVAKTYPYPQEIEAERELLKKLEIASEFVYNDHIK